MQQHARQLVRLVFLGMMTAVVVGCSAAPNASAPSAAMPRPTLATTAVPTATVPAATPDVRIQGIQRVLDQFAEAFNTNDLALLDRAIDATNQPFRLFMRSRLASFQQVQQSGERRSYRLRDVTEALPDGFVAGEVEANDGQIAVVTFRLVGDRWVLAEPTAAQVGPKMTQDTPHFRLEYHPWSERRVASILPILDAAYTRVTTTLGTEPDGKATVYLKPIYGIGAPDSPQVVAYYDSDTQRLVVADPTSYVFGFYDAATGWEPRLTQVLAHEYTHLVVDRAFVPLGKLRDWMSEGIAEYVAGDFHDEAIRLALQRDALIPIRDASQVNNRQDLEHATQLPDADLAYGLSASLVRYIVERYGGLDGFWRFVRIYADRQDLERALQDSFGISYRQFDAGWRAWLRQAYG